jgi:hypothetical protein
MMLKRSLAISCLGWAMLAAPLPAAAQPAGPVEQGVAPEPAPPPPLVTPGRRRIEINPRPLLYRRCTDWYEIQNRPSGTVLYPQKRCWWVRG